MLAKTRVLTTRALVLVFLGDNTANAIADALTKHKILLTLFYFFHEDNVINFANVNKALANRTFKFQSDKFEFLWWHSETTSN